MSTALGHAAAMLRMELTRHMITASEVPRRPAVEGAPGDGDGAASLAETIEACVEAHAAAAAVMTAAVLDPYGRFVRQPPFDATAYRSTVDFHAQSIEQLKMMQRSIENFCT